jgi:DNA mismatch repair protein MutL
LIVPRIEVLSEALASQIAAGEVVERPASVVKELVENSLDAKAGSITVLIEKSGKDRIRVADDGIGMDCDDARLALERHATSKLSSTSDLARILTLGFRGEALPSIASVSHFTLQTRDEASAAGYELVIEGGKLVREGKAGLPRGTIIDVRRLFFNVPARRKFLRSEVTEAAHIASLMSNLAAAFPEVRFRLDHGRKNVLDAPSVRSRRERLFQIEGSWLEGAVPVEESVGHLALEGWLSAPADARGTSSRLHLFVNGRPVKDKTLSHAVLEAYRQASSKPGTPLVYLFLELPPEKVDVNVHPAKTEVRFVDQRFIHQAVFSILRNVLTAEGRAPELHVGSTSSARNFVGEAVASYTGVVRRGGFAQADSSDRVVGRGKEMAEALLGPGVEAETPAFAELASKPPAVLGQFRDSFIVAADDDGVWLIDQHAAHERILYEELVERHEGGEVPQQLLLTPVHLELSPSERVTMEEEIARFLAFGFDIEPFGTGSYVIRAVPAVLSGLNIEKLIRSALSEREQECPVSAIAEAQGRIAARLACHAAIKIHHPLATEKMRFLLERLWKARQPTVCPHGRPTTLRVGLTQIEKRFGRI